MNCFSFTFVWLKCESILNDKLYMIEILDKNTVDLYKKRYNDRRDGKKKVNFHSFRMLNLCFIPSGLFFIKSIEIFLVDSLGSIEIICCYLVANSKWKKKNYSRQVIPTVALIDRKK